MRNRDLITFPLQYLRRKLSTFIIYCEGVTVFPFVNVLGLYNYN